jgi:hypothetical protein
MKPNRAHLNSTLLAICLVTISSLNGFSQPDYVFKNSVLLSGTDKGAGAQYRFPSVKTGVDAIVKISSISTDITIIDFDDNKNGGFDEAFQPRIQAKAKTKGYAEFNITFVVTGTNIPLLMTEVPATSIDVDGNKSATDSMFEFDEYMTPGTYQLDYDLVSTDLKFVYSTGSVMGKNFRGLEKALIDTMAMEAMFSVIYPNVNSFTVRIGLDNQLNVATTRQRSVYFKRFFFQNSFLPVTNLLSFIGNRNADNSVVLNWTMSSQHDYAVADIEKCVNGHSFVSIGSVPVSGKSTSLFSDNSKTTFGAYYRLKMTDKNGKIGYSAIIYIRSNSNYGKIKVFPSMVNDNTNITFVSDNASPAKISLFDLGGRLVMKKDIAVQAGNNTLALTGLSQFSTGQYLVVVSTEGHQYTQKIQRSN